MQGYCVFPRPGRSVWYIKFPDATAADGWRSKASPFRIDDPQGKRRALALAEKLSNEFKVSGTHRRAEMWATWVRTFLTDKYQASPRTLQSYEGAWACLQEFLQEKRVHLPAMLNYNHVVAYVVWRTNQKRHSGARISRNTALQDLRVLSLIMREAVRRNFAQGNPCERTGLRRDPAKEKRAFLKTEIEQVRGELRKREGELRITERWMTVCWEIALQQGCRLTETQVPMSLVDEQARTITFAGKGRGGMKRVFTTTLHPQLVPLIAELRNAGASVTCRLPRMAAKEWHFFFKKLEMRGVSFHCTRVTVITQLARAGVPEQQAMRFVNHASREVHRIYQKLQTDDLSACTSALNF